MLLHPVKNYRVTLLIPQLLITRREEKVRRETRALQEEIALQYPGLVLCIFIDTGEKEDRERNREKTDDK